MVCCFATLLFVTGDLIVEVSIIYVVRQELGGRTIAPVVLAETMNGLDMVTARGRFFWVAPILFYMWLLERFRFISANQILPGIMHDPGQFFRRPSLMLSLGRLLGGPVFFRRVLGILGGACPIGG